jgi:quercetin dioxygenase-like cupin family protein
MKITNLEKTERKQMEMEGASNVWKQVPLGSADSSPSFAVRVFTLGPYGHTPYHAHPFEHLNYVITGEGVVVRGGGEEEEVKTGDFILVLPGEKHQYRNKSTTGPFVIICAVPKEYE